MIFHFPETLRIFFLCREKQMIALLQLRRRHLRIWRKIKLALKTLSEMMAAPNAI